MTENPTNRIMLIITETAHLRGWADLAQQLALPDGEIFLRGMVTVPEGNTLSEGVTQAHCTSALDHEIQGVVENRPRGRRRTARVFGGWNESAGTVRWGTADVRRGAARCGHGAASLLALAGRTRPTRMRVSQFAR